MSIITRYLNRVISPIKSLLQPFARILSFPTRMIGAPGRVLGLSLPTRVALLVFVSLLLLFIVAFVAYTNTNQNAQRNEWLTPSRLISIILLLCVTPLVVWKTVKLFIEGTISAFPDIDKAWAEGMAELAKHNLNITQLPVFLILGGSSSSEIDSVVEGSRSALIVKGTPSGRAPLRWYANDQAIYLACTGTGCLTLANQLTGVTSSSPDDLTKTAVSGGFDAGGTLAPGTETMGPGDLGGDAGVRQTASADPAPGLFGTMVAGVSETMVPGQAVESRQAAFSGTRLTRDQIDEQFARLRHVARLLKRARQPYCPHNGLMTLLPWPVIQRDAMLASREVAAAIQNDIDCISSTTELHAPITALITGMETEKGFMELIRRVGSKYARSRFGKGFDVSNTTTRHNMEALASHARGAFEDWVYQLFKSPGGLTKPGNTSLYALLCKIRSRLATRLKNMLQNGFGRKPEDQERNMLVGLYFAATGSSTDTRCFIDGAVEKMNSLHDDVEWTAAARQKNRRYVTIAQVTMFYSFLVLVLLGIIVYQHFQGN